MTGQRDIDRTLDVWFVDGPSVMPDRLFDAVLDQVERTPQRPFARLRLRLTDMNRNFRWLAAAAAALVLVLVALATINRPPDDSVGAPSSPVVSPSSAASEVPTELRSIWLGGLRPIPGLAADAGVALTLTADGISMSQSAGNPADKFVATAGAAGPNRLQVTTGSNVFDCPEGATGTYTWSLSTSGQTLEIVAEEDTCGPRLAGVPGTYWREDCPSGENCLGPVDAGTYGSQFFDPYIGLEDTWAPRYGALTYAVPDAWVNAQDFPGSYSLAPAGAGDETMIFLVSDIVATDQSDFCSELADPELGTTAAEITDWLSTAEGVIASTPEAVSIGGLDGYRIDISLDPSWTGTCPATGAEPYRILFADRPAAGGFAWGVGPGTAMRLSFLDIEDGRAIWIDYESSTRAGFDADLDAATTVIESFVFTP